MPHRVLYIARAPFVSGAERALESMLRHLDGNQVQAGVILGHDTALSQSIQAMGWPLWQVPLAQRTWKTWRGWRTSVAALRRVIREFKPTILHANDVPSTQAMSVLGDKLSLPRLVHVRWGIHAHDMSWWTPRGCETVLCISQWVREQLGNPAGTRLAQSHIVVLPDAVDWPADRKPLLPTTERQAGQPVRIGFAGQLIPDKGLDLIIRALAQIPEPMRPILLVAGRDTQHQGRYQAQLQELAQELNVAANIRWLGFLSQVSDLYQQVHAMVCPSRVEPLGLIPLEAARFALPTLAHDTGGFRETILDGQTGWRVPLEDVEAWARALTQLQDAALTQRLGLAAQRHAQSHFAPSIYQQKLLDLYDTMAQPRTRIGSN